MTFIAKIFAALLLVVTLASAQRAYSPQPANDIPTFKANAELVLVPVVVSDKNGAHIHGLDRADFAVLEDDRVKEITVFEAVHTEPRVMHLASANDVFTNTVKPEATQARVTIIVLDTLNTAFMDQVRARHEIIKFLSNLEPGEPVALINLSKSGLNVIHDFTSDPAILAAAVKKVKGQFSFQDTSGDDRVSENLTPIRGRAGTITDDIVQSDGTINGDPSVEVDRLLNIETQTEGVFAAMEQGYSIRLTLEAMRQLAKAFTGVPG